MPDGPLESTAEAPEVATGSTAQGPGRLLVAVYAVFALAAVSRAGVQIGLRFAEAPVAYSLSAFSGAVYLVATVALATARRWSRPLAWAAVGVELVGVLAVGAFSVFAPGDFPKDTVWSGFGRGYVFVPLVLPLVGLFWLFRTSPRR